MPRNQIELTPRQRQIFECINREGITTVNALGQEASCSTSSVRRDLQTLDETGLIKRIRGGAESLSVATVTSHLYRLQKSSHWTEKSRIGRAAAELVNDHEAIAVNYGTTAMALATCLFNKNDLTVITNDIEIAQFLCSKPDFEVILIGGRIQKEVPSTVGGFAAEMWRSFYFDKGFLAVMALHPDEGLMTRTLEEAEIGRAFIDRCNQTIIITDHSKFYKRGGTTFAPFQAADILVTDKGIQDNSELLKKVQDSGIQLILA